jgi:hypothetical protein
MKGEKKASSPALEEVPVFELELDPPLAFEAFGLEEADV